MGCSCKKKNQTVSNQTINIQVSESPSTTSNQEVTIESSQLEQIIKKVEDINRQIDEESTVE
jgi:hypothetical protein